MMDVSVIIVNYNTRELTDSCIKSIEKETYDVKYEVIVIDNASQDGSKEFFENRPNIKYIYSSENLGFGRANNLGAKYATGQYLFLLNSDTLFLNNALKYFLEYVKTLKSERICLGAFLRDEKLKITHSSGKFPTIKSVLFQYLTLPFRKKAFSYPNDDVIIDVDYIIGADLFISSSNFSKIGGFDESFFLYYEETDLQLRIKNVGIKRQLIPGPHIIHLEGCSSPQPFRRKKAFWPIHSSFIYFKKHSSRMQYILFRFLSFIVLSPYCFFLESKTSRKAYINTLTVKL